MNPTTAPANAVSNAAEQIAAAAIDASPHLHPPLFQSLGLMAVYAFAGVIVAVLGYKLFDLCTPGDLHKEIIENRNVAAAIVGAAIIIGVCILVAASILG